jgi:DNA-binding CsgD family transcriptional regulator
LLDHAGKRHPGSLFFLAEAGLGKSVALECACRRAADASFLVGRGRANTMESSLPFGPVSQALADLGGPDLGSADVGPPAGDARAAQFYRVLRWLEETAAKPVLLAFDDLHWADADSLALISFLCRRFGSTPVALIGTLRPWPSEAHELAAGLSHDGRALIERLAPLTEEASGALLVARLGQPISEEVLRRSSDLCAGNPLLLEQVAVAIERGEEVPTASTPGPAKTVSDDLLLSRFAGLPAEGMRCAQAAAIFGTHFVPELAARVAKLEEPEADAALDALDRTGLVRQVSADGLDFVHPLFRQALYDDLSAPIRSRLHARAYSVLGEHGMEAEAAEHAVLANLVGNGEAVSLLERVGRTARRMGALATAVDRLTAAVHLSGDRPKPELLLALGEALVAGGSQDDAIAVCERLLGRPELSDAGRAEALATMGRASAVTGHHDQAAARFEHAVALAEHEAPVVAVQVLLEYVASSWFTTGPAQSLPLTKRARELARATSEPLQLAAEAAWAFIALMAGDASGIEVLAPVLWPLAADPLADVGTLGRARGPLTNLARGLIFVERFEEADLVIGRLEAAAERFGSPRPIAFLAFIHGWALIRMGRLTQAQERIGRSLSLVDLVPMVDAFASVGQADILLSMGRLSECEAWCERVEALATARGESNALLFLWDVRGRRHLREGRVATACETYARLEATVRRLGIGEPCVPPWARHAASAYLAAGRIEDAARVVDWVEAHASQLPCRFPRIAAATGRAQLAEVRGDREAADSAFASALALHDGVDLPLEKVETLLAYGGFLRRHGQLARARPLLAEALELAEASEAEWLASQARDDLRVAGGRRRRRREEPGRLTTQEQRVAELVATGATNPEIARQLYLSVSTIETHLERVYAKLGIHSRRELMARASRPPTTGRADNEA